MMIAERQNREKTIPKRRKKEKLFKVMAKDETNDEYDEDDDEDKDEDDSVYVDNVKEAITETTEALTVIHILIFQYEKLALNFFCLVYSVRKRLRTS